MFEFPPLIFQAALRSLAQVVAHFHLIGPILLSILYLTEIIIAYVIFVLK
jgi:hypothetical protein